MKKVLTIVLVALMMLSTSAVALADNTTVLTTTVPAATYTLNIPADQTIDFGATKAEIGCVSVTDSSGFAVGKNLDVTMTYSPFVCEEVSTTIPFTVGYSFRLEGSPDGTVSSGDSITFKGTAEGTVHEYHQFRATTSDDFDYDAKVYYIISSSSDWGKALAGEYSSTITFTAEVVVE